MQSKIVELDLNEIETVTGGTRYAMLSSSTTLQTSYASTMYVKPTYASTSFPSPSLAIAPTLKPI